MRNSTSQDMKEIDAVAAVMEEASHSTERISQAVARHTDRAVSISSKVAEADRALNEITEAIMEIAEAGLSLSAHSSRAALGTEQLVCGMHEVHGVINRSTSASLAVNLKLKELRRVVDAMFRIVSEFQPTGSSAVLQALKRAHQDWKLQVDRSMDGEDLLGPAAAGDHAGCEFSRLYAGLQVPDNPRARAAYNAVGSYHGDLHQHARDMLESHDGNALLALQKLLAFESCMTNFFLSLDDYFTEYAQEGDAADGSAGPDTN